MSRRPDGLVTPHPGALRLGCRPRTRQL